MECLRCHWVINQKTKRKKVEEILMEILRFINKPYLKNKILKYLENQRSIVYPNEKDFPICRYCLIETIAHCLEKRDEDKVLKKFLPIYDFQGALIT